MASRSIALSLPLALALLSACQLTPAGAPTFLTPTFRLQAPGGAGVGAAGVPSEGATTVRVSPPADGAAAPAYDGRLTVRFGHLLGQPARRRLLATIADVDKVTIKLAGNGVSHTQTITKAMIVGGMTSFTFAGLPAGALTVTLEALDAGGKVIGADIQQATVTSGQTTVVTSTVRLDPPSPSPRTIIAGGSGSGGSGGSGSGTGSLATDITIVEGAPVISPPVTSTYTSGGLGINGLGLGQDGRLWLQEPDSWQIKTFDRAGNFGSAIAREGPAVSGMLQHFDTSDPGGRVLYNFIGDFSWQSGIAVVAANGASVMSGYTNVPDGDAAAAADPQGRLWCLDGAGLRRFADPLLVDPQTQLFAFAESHPVLGTGEKLAIDGAGNFWVTAYRRAGPSAWEIGILKYDPSFNLVFEAWQPGNGTYYRDLALDGQGNVWIAYNGDKGTIEKRSPSGAILKSVRSAAPLNHLFIDANGHVWGFNRTHYPHLIASNTGGAGELVMRLGPDGELQGYYALGEGVDLTGLVVTPDGQMWVGTETKGLLHYTLPPLPSPSPGP